MALMTRGGGPVSATGIWEAGTSCNTSQAEQHSKGPSGSKGHSAKVEKALSEVMKYNHPHCTDGAK